MNYFNCKVCRTSLSAEDDQTGQAVRCPSCLTTLTVPGTQAPNAPPLPTRKPSVSTTNGPGRRYGFNCVYCSSRLEATESMAAQQGQCPTCGSDIIIPILDRYGRLIDPVTQEILKPDPHPVHAYAAAGERAPQVLRQNDGSHLIRCSKCNQTSPVTANNCKSCGMPFTMEGTTAQANGASNGFGVASLVLGIVGIPFACTVIVPLLAIVFGAVAVYQTGKQPGQRGGRGLGIAGIVCGVIGLALAATIFNR